MKTYIEMEKLTPKRLWKFPQKRFGALVGPFSRFFGFSRFPGSVATLFFVGGGARGVQAFDPPPGDTFEKIAKYKLWGHIWMDRRRNAQILNAK